MQVYGKDGHVFEGTPEKCAELVAKGYRSRPYPPGEVQKPVEPVKAEKKGRK